MNVRSGSTPAVPCRVIGLSLAFASPPRRRKLAPADWENVESIVLMGSGAPSMAVARAAQANKVQRIVALQQQGLIPEQIRTLQDILPSYFADPGFEMPGELENLYYNPTAEQLTWSALGDYDFTTDVARLNHPALILWGESDPFGIQMAEATVSALSNARVEFVTLEACGHFWHECPAPFFSHVEAFLKQNHFLYPASTPTGTATGSGLGSCTGWTCW